MQRENPLKQYFRQFKIYIKLPSGTNYYENNVIEFNDMGEIGIMPMTGQDELLLKNPDALLNGEALIEVIKSCVPSVKNPKKLLNNDIDAIVTAIRKVTFEDKIQNEIICPNCKKENLYKLDLQYALDNMEFLEPEYVVNLDSGLSVFVKPYTFVDVIRGLHVQFEQAKLAKALDAENIKEEEKLKILSTSMKNMATLTFELMCDSIIKVVDDSKNINVTEKEFITEFIKNLDKNNADKIAELITSINSIGIKKTYKAVCSHCKHEWENDLDINPVNFS